MRYPWKGKEQMIGATKQVPNQRWQKKTLGLQIKRQRREDDERLCHTFERHAIWLARSKQRADHTRQEKGSIGIIKYKYQSKDDEKLCLIFERQAIPLASSKWAPNGNGERLCLTLERQKDLSWDKMTRAKKNNLRKTLTKNQTSNARTNRQIKKMCPEKEDPNN